MKTIQWLAVFLSGAAIMVGAVGVWPAPAAGQPAGQQPTAEAAPMGRRRNAPAEAAVMPLVGQVAAYEPGQSLTLEVRRRGGTTQQTQFRITDGRTTIELRGDLKSIAVGTPVSVWPDKDDATLAARIVAGTNPPSRRPTAQPGAAMPAMRGPARASTAAPPEAIVMATVATRPLRPPVAGLSPSGVARRIDELLEARLAVDGAGVASECDDAEFVRRAWLDIAGVIPPADRAANFIDSRDPQKRARLIDELLSSPAYGQHFGRLWSDRLVSRDLPVDAQPLAAWLTEVLNQGRGWDEIVVDLVTSGGSFTPIRLRAPGAAHTPPAFFLLANSEDNEPRPDRLAGAAAGLFLGVQVQCAECHDHPFAEWKQREFWGLAAFFGQVRASRTPALSYWEDALPSADTPPSIAIPSTALKSVGTTVPARFLDGREFRPSDGETLRAALARWMTADDNPYFARAAVNRLWAHFFGRGLVNPVDDLHSSNPPTHPAVLELLAMEFTRSRCDLRHLIRCLCASRAYQRTGQPPSPAHSDESNYGWMPAKVMSPGVLYDSLAAATGWRELRLGLPGSKSKLGVTMPMPPREAFIDFFRTREEEAAAEYSFGIPQALKLLNGEPLNRPSPVAERLAGSGASRDRAVEELYLTALARRPTSDESRIVADFLARRTESGLAEAYAAVLWSLVNSSEFVLNH